MTRPSGFHSREMSPPKLTGHRGANQKIAEPFIANRRCDLRPSLLRPRDDNVSISVCAVDLDSAGG